MKSLSIALSLLIAAPIVGHADYNVQTKSENVRPDGTKVSTETSHKDSVDSDGDKKVVEKTSTEIDPKGMMNKKLAKKHSVRESEASGDYSDSDTIRHADGTKEKVKASRETSKHWTNEGKDTTTTYSKTVDPKGLGNKRSVEVTEEVETNPGEQTKKTVTKKVDGTKVSEETKTVQ